MDILTNSLTLASHIKGCTREVEDKEAYIVRIYHCKNLMIEFITRPGGISWHIANDDWLKLLQSITNNLYEDDEIVKIVTASDRFKLNGMYIAHKLGIQEC